MERYGISSSHRIGKQRCHLYVVYIYSIPCIKNGRCASVSSAQTSSSHFSTCHCLLVIVTDGAEYRKPDDPHWCSPARILRLPNATGIGPCAIPETGSFEPDRHTSAGAWDELAPLRPKCGQYVSFLIAAWHATCKPRTLFMPLTSSKRNGQPELSGRPG